MNLDEKVRDWMWSLGFEDNTDAEIPHYYMGLRCFVEPSNLVKVVAKDSQDWNPVDDASMISPECAKLFYLLAKKGAEWDDEAEIELPPVAEPKPGDIIFDKVRM